MNYEKPAVIDFGDLVELTKAGQLLGTADGAAFVSVQANVGPISLSLALLP